MQPSISIVVPAYNEANYIAKTLQSIKEQNFKDYEVIVVANGCTDETEKVVKSQNLPVTLYSLPKANVSRARNFGAGKAQGELLLFLDADTQLGADTLHQIHQNFSSEHAVATTQVMPDVGKLHFKLVMGCKNFVHQAKLYQGCSGALICRRADFNQVNGYNPNIIVKEHRKLIQELRKVGKYTCIDTYVTTSMRRLQQWGIAQSAWFWSKQWLKDRFSTLDTSEYEKVR